MTKVKGACECASLNSVWPVPGVILCQSGCLAERGMRGGREGGGRSLSDSHRVRDASVTQGRHVKYGLYFNCLRF